MTPALIRSTVQLVDTVRRPAAGLKVDVTNATWTQLMITVHRMHAFACVARACFIKRPQARGGYASGNRRDTAGIIAAQC